MCKQSNARSAIHIFDTSRQKMLHGSHQSKVRNLKRATCKQTAICAWRLLVCAPEYYQVNFSEAKIVALTFDIQRLFMTNSLYVTVLAN